MIAARYQTRHGGSGMRSVPDAAEAERFLRRQAGRRLETRLEDAHGEVVGEARRFERGWTWWLDPGAWED